MDNSNIEVNEVFPDKPYLDKDDNSLMKSIISVTLFIGSFYFFFDKNITYILVLVGVLFIHELGHFLAMKYFNYKDVKMFFIPLLGALVTGKKQEISQKQRTIILLAGPVPGIIIGLILYVIGTGSNDQNLLMSANIFIFLNIFNLLPITPFDGGNLIETLFFSSKEILKIIFIVLSAAGLIAIALFLESYFLLIIPFFLLIRINALSKVKKIKSTLAILGIDYDKPFDELTNEEYWKIREQIILETVAFKNVKPKDYTVSKHEKQIINHIESLSVKIPKADLSKTVKALIVALWLLCFIGPFFALGAVLNTFKPSPIESREQMIQECMGSVEESTFQNLEETRAYCECSIDKILTNFTDQERRDHEELTEDELMTLYLPIMLDCYKSLQTEIEIDTSEVENINED